MNSVRLSTRRRKFGKLLAVALLSALLARTAQASPISGGTPPVTGPPPGEASTNLAHGLFVARHTDLAVAGLPALRFTRSYRTEAVDSSGNFIAGPFGMGTNFGYNVFLYSESEAAGQGYQNVDLILPDGGRIFCNRTSSCGQSGCTDYTDAAFQCTSNPTPFFGATIQYSSNPQGWTLTTREGTVYTFGFGAPLQSIKDRYGNQVMVSRNASVDVTQVSSSGGGSITFTYGDTNNPHQITRASDPGGETVTYTYDSSHRMTSFTDAAGNTFQIAYESAANQLGDIQSITDPLSQMLDLTYDANRFLRTLATGSTSSSSTTTIDTYTYQVGNPLTAPATYCDIQDANSNHRRLTYDSAGYVSTDTRAFGSTNPPAETTTIQRYSGSELIKDIIDPLIDPGTATGRDTHIVYETGGGGAIISSKAVSITRLYENSSQAVTTGFTYGAFDQLASITDPLNHTTAIGLDSAGNAVSFTDPMNTGTWHFTYNSNGTPASSQDPLGNPATIFSYFSSGMLASVTDPLGNKTQFNYDAANRLISTTDALRNTYGYAHDGNGHVTQASAPNGITIHLRRAGQDADRHPAWRRQPHHSVFLRFGLQHTRGVRRAQQLSHLRIR